MAGTLANVPPKGGRKHPQQEFIQVDTSNILFIVGGAFEGMDRIIKQRTGKKSLGFGVQQQDDKKEENTSLFARMETEDLVKFGMIPEFTGRVPVVAALNELDETALVEVLTKPKNALIKQYMHLIGLEGVTLTFSDEAIAEVAHQAKERKTGARGLRAILEQSLLDIMYDIPSNGEVKEVIMTKEAILGEKAPVFVLHKEALAG